MCFFIFGEKKTFVFFFDISLVHSLSPSFPHHAKKTTTTTSPLQKKQNAGYSGVTVGLVNTHYVYLPTPLLILAPRRVDPRSKMWNRLRSSLKQPSLVGDGDGEFDEWEDDEY